MNIYEYLSLFPPLYMYLQGMHHQLGVVTLCSEREREREREHEHVNVHTRKAAVEQSETLDAVGDTEVLVYVPQQAANEAEAVCRQHVQQ